MNTELVVLRFFLCFSSVWRSSCISLELSLKVVRRAVCESQEVMGRQGAALVSLHGGGGPGLGGDQSGGQTFTLQLGEVEVTAGRRLEEGAGLGPVQVVGPSTATAALSLSDNTDNTATAGQESLLTFLFPELVIR